MERDRGSDLALNTEERVTKPYFSAEVQKPVAVFFMSTCKHIRLSLGPNYSRG